MPREPGFREDGLRFYNGKPQGEVTERYDETNSNISQLHTSATYWKHGLKMTIDQTAHCIIEKKQIFVLLNYSTSFQRCMLSSQTNVNRKLVSADHHLQLFRAVWLRIFSFPCNS
jgi:hypothetical protein